MQPSSVNPTPRPDSGTIFFAGGGTGGHLYPGIAVAQALLAAGSKLRPVFLCTQRAIDRVILEPTGFEFIPQPIVPPVKTVGGLLKFWNAWRETKELVSSLIGQHQPAAILGLGGYAAGAAVKLAGRKHIPTALINPDVIPGKANQYLLRYVSAICCQFEQTRQYLPGLHRSKMHVTGCPIRREFVKLPARGEAMARLGLDPMMHTLVITGASLGAKTVNEGVLEALAKMKIQGWQVLHLAGRDHAESVRVAYREMSARPHRDSEQGDIPVRVIDFIPAMWDVWAVADLAVSRAGASTCAELTATGIPSILLPYPFHRDKHQRLNAQILADSGAAVLCNDEMDRRKNGRKLEPILQSLLFDANKRSAMSAAAKSLAHLDASNRVASVVMEMTRQPTT